jgi:hypothetical protein
LYFFFAFCFESRERKDLFVQQRDCLFHIDIWEFQNFGCCW